MSGGVESITLTTTTGHSVTATPGQMRRALNAVSGRKRASDDQGDIEDVTGEGDIGETTREVGGIAADRLRSIVERVERLEEERKALGDDIKDIFTEAKSAGFDVKVLRQLIALRRKEPAEIEEQETLLDVYRRALGC